VVEAVSEPKYDPAEDPRLIGWMGMALAVLPVSGGLVGSYVDKHGGPFWAVPVGMGAGLMTWAAAYVLLWVLSGRVVAGAEQHKYDVEMPTQRDRNRQWIKHAREHGATEVRIWWAVGEYDDAEDVDVPIGQALGVLAKHGNDYHLDAVGRHADADVTQYLSEYVFNRADS
jgi:hypothetical protein